MNTDLEARLTESMHHQVDGLTLSGDVLTRATRRHRRRSAAIRLGSVLGVAALAVSVAFALDQGPAPDATAPPSLRLANAAAASDDISYRLKLTTNGLSYEGAFDPRTDTGYVRAPQDDSVMTELLVDGTRYIGGEPPLDTLPSDKGQGETYGRYGQYPGVYDHLSLYGGGVLGAASPDPAALFAALRSAGATVTENADGSLHFEYTTRTADGSTATKGDVTLNADGRIARVAMTGTWQSTAKGRLDTGTFTATLELYDYGLPVTVERPKDVVPAN
ncbi:hypothetical protein ABZS66_13625 [Dactylosporangium sp. NPDC005572]|uniref:hypothetical protein n=1 Tax=Dactylosporangium sp. NPDC005572 TaxID=3156889 RepID=UPI0033A7F80B